MSVGLNAEYGSDSSGSIWSCGISSPSPTHQFKAVPVLHSRHLDRRQRSVLSRSPRLQTGRNSRRACVYHEVERYLRRVLFITKLPCGNVCDIPYTPLVLIAILYIIIYVKLKSHKIPGNCSINTERQRLRRERNVLKMAAAVVLGFAVCWLPFGIVILVSFFKWDQATNSSCDVGHLFTVLALMTRANCAINPCICFISSGNFRKGLKNFLTCS